MILKDELNLILFQPTLVEQMDATAKPYYLIERNLSTYENILIG